MTKAKGSSLRGSLIGLGAMGRRHLIAMRTAGLQIAGACDIREEACRSAVADRELLATECYRDADQMLMETKPDVVVVATTAPSHASLVSKAAESGASFILCEKPMAQSLADCDRMIEVCRANGVRLAINHQMRFMPHYLSIRDLIESEEFGGWSSLTVVAGNFGMAMNGIHYFELFRWLTGGLPSQVSAWLETDPSPNPRGSQFKDTSGAVRVVAPSGQRLYLDAGLDQGHGIRFICAGPKGVLVVDELKGAGTVSVRLPSDAELPSSRYASEPRSWALDLEPAETVEVTRLVLEALLDGSNYPTGNDGRAALQCLLAAHASSDLGGVAQDPRAAPVDSHLPIA